MIRIPTKIIRHAPHLMPPPELLGPQLPIPVVAPSSAIRRTMTAAASTWAELHKRALSHEGKDDTLWLFLFGARISGGCECQKNWKNEIQAVPPDFNNYFFWSVAIHNVVNARLKKPQITIDEARAIWAKPVTPTDQSGPAAAA